MFVPVILGDPSKAKQELGWTAKTSFDALVEGIRLAYGQFLEK